MRSAITICLAVLASICMVGGCAPKSETSTQTEINAFSHPPAATPEQRAENLQEQIDNFKRLHPERYADGKITGPTAAVQSAPATGSR